MFLHYKEFPSIGILSGTPGPLRQDTFNRGDTTDIGTPSDGGSAWEEIAGTGWGVTGNQGYDSSSGAGHIAVLESSNAIVSVRCTFNSVAGDGGDCGLVLRLSDSSNYIFLTFSESINYFALTKIVAGVTTTLDVDTVDTADGDVIRLEVTSGDVITVYQNDVERLTATDSFNSSATKHGLWANFDGQVRFENFSIWAN